MDLMSTKNNDRLIGLGSESKSVYNAQRLIFFCLISQTRTYLSESQRTSLDHSRYSKYQNQQIQSCAKITKSESKEKSKHSQWNNSNYNIMKYDRK